MWILLGEDQKQFGQQIYQRLRNSFDVDWLIDVKSLRSGFLHRTYALLVLGLDVPVPDRMQLLAEYRAVSKDSAIMVVSDVVPVHERVQALEAGADDYLTRPVHLDELAARAKALVRRVEGKGLPQIQVGNLKLSNDGEFYFGGDRVNLQSGEERLLTILMRRSGRLVTKEMIDRALASESEAMSANAIEQRVSRLRRVLEVARTDIQIKTVRGSGYVLEPASRQTASQPSASFGDAI